MERCRVLRIEEQMYGCEELPEGAEVCCDVTVEAADGTRKTLSCPDAALIRQGIGEGDRVLWDGMELKKGEEQHEKDRDFGPHRSGCTGHSFLAGRCPA